MDWKKVIGAVAPTLARTFGGPLGGMAANAIGAALGTEPTEDAIEKKVTTMTAGDLIALKEAEAKFKLDLKAADIDIARIDAADRADARKMQVDTRSRTAPILAFTAVGLMIGLVYVVGWRVIPEANRSAFDILLGGVIGSYTTVLTFYFGSSHGSQAKDQTVAALAGDSSGK